MPRFKERKKFIHEPSTKEIFYCFSHTLNWVQLLPDNYPDATYVDFLRFLIQKDFYKDSGDKLTIKKISEDYKEKTTKVTSWITKIYEDIFELNESQPELFVKDGIRVSLYIKYYDNSCSFELSLPVVPREFEMFNFYFVRAKMGTDYFWVKRVQHEVYSDCVNITVWLEGGLMNKYRELAYDKARFQGYIGLFDEHQMSSSEINKLLRETYRD